MSSALSPTRASSLCLLASASLSLIAAGCGGGGGGGGASAAAAVSSGTASATTSGAPTSSGPVAVGPLTRKALEFEKTMQAQHLGLGQVQDVIVDPSGTVQRTGGAPSRLLWTGFYTASQAMRYRSTQDPDALANLERGLQTLHDLHEVTGYPGAIARGYDLPTIETQGHPAGGRFAGYNYNKGTPSRDQYAGWFYGVGHGFKHLQDPALRQALIADVRAVCDILQGNDLQMSSPWGPTGAVEDFFNLRPDYFYQNQINPQTWATVDDFPINLITKSIPYDPQLAAAIQTASIPPIRSGEALKALFFFTVAEHVTGDPKYTAYKQQLLFQRDYLNTISRYLTMTDDLFYGRNLQVAEDALKQLFQAVGDIVQAYLVAQGQSALVTQLLLPITTAGVSGWLSDLVVDIIAWIHDPNNQGKLQSWVQRLQFGSAILSLVGQQKLAGQINTFVTQYGQNLGHQGLIDLAKTMRSHLGVNLNLMPLTLMIELETDPQVKATYRTWIDRNWEFLQADHNPMVNLLHQGYGTPSPTDMPHTLETLRRFPTDMSMREVDNSNYPGLVRSTWPDRFGRTGQHSLQPEYFEIDERAPDIFPWRGHPRQIKTGSNNPNVKVAPLGYLMPYWFARDLGLLGLSD